MNIELKDFQQAKTASLIDDLAAAKASLRERGRLQALILSAPTASGKTVMMASLIERVFGGDGGLHDVEFEPEPEAVFLWISDQPTLNKQSRDRISTASARLKPQDLRIVDTDFDAEYFEGGKLYFLSSQKIGRDKLLTRYADGRQFTIWDTIRNTQRLLPESFYVVIDEAHRGMRLSDQDRREANSIVQRFLVGSDEMPPMNIVLGITATPARFMEFLGGNTSRTICRTDVDPSDVRRSGLIKDEILLYSTDTQHPSEWTLLAEACRTHNLMSREWADYCDKNRLEVVTPALIIQIEDGPGPGGSPSRTNLNQLLTILYNEIPGITEANVAHCLDDDSDLIVGGRSIKYADPSTIDRRADLRAVIFKMALSTGWDCPRAEVMMSFRSAHDPTSIAQLVGRMVRTPLAERAEGNDLLNQVYLYLPRYDRAAVDVVIDHLMKDKDNVPATRVRRGGETKILRLSAGLEEALAKINTLPTYQMLGARKTTNLRRLVKLVRLLNQHGIMPSGGSSVIPDLAAEMITYLNSRLSHDESLRQNLLNLETVKCRVVTVENGDIKVTNVGEKTIRVTPRDVDTLFAKAKARLTDEIAMAVWRRRYSPETPLRAKIEVFELSQDGDLWRQIEDRSERAIDDLMSLTQGVRLGLGPEHKAKYDEIAATSKSWRASYLNIGETITVDSEEGEVPFGKHMFVNDSGHFTARLNDWESRVIAEEVSKPDLVAWLRNVDQKSWALRYPYNLDTKPKAAFPDFIVIMRVDGTLRVDVLEPHEGKDSVAKAKGMAWYWEQNPGSFGRMQMIRLMGGNIVAIDFSQGRIRSRVRELSSAEDLDRLFEREARGE